MAAAPDLAHPYLPSSGATSGCIGKCCGTGVCCGAAVIQAPTPAIPEVGILTLVVWPVVDRHAGIDPDGLSRPPKVLA
jgi:hypothetical protein